MPRASRRVAVTAAAVAAAMTSPLVATTAQAKQPASPQHVVNTYFADWDIYGRGYLVKDIPADELNHITYAFAAPDKDGLCAAADPWADYQKVFDATQTVDGVADTWTQPLAGNFNQILQLKKAHPGLRVNLALGGWTLSTYFSDVAKKDSSRKAFVQSCLDRFIRGDLPGLPAGAAKGVFDGIDLDWEYPGVDPGNGNHFTAEDKHNATQLLREFRKELDAQGAADAKHYELTAALPATAKASQYYELQKVARELDYVDLMTYDFHGPYEPATSFNSPFTTDPTDPNPGVDATWSTSATVDYYLSQGVPAEKLVVGTAFYGKQYIRVGSANGGVYQPFDDTGLSGAVTGVSGSTTPTYRDLVQAGILSPAGAVVGEGWVRGWNAATGEPYLWNPSASHTLSDGSTVSVPTFISYDDPQSLQERVDLVQAKGLRGVMAWEVSQDTDDATLLGTYAPLLH
ncbi:chitinase [Motilibacter rhizosphaerae]|uniref:chitinase n=1 Tax=Motilibacter rhizosphaerae TaxID=598652 RepID=A0A4Q7NT57_9ACTN|nr:glycoside hydrolase family 18 protein [Motilibacter rhizosphaerae]RZS89978.1 chitinase [Motilibacter rhizosphaerae]